MDSRIKDAFLKSLNEGLNQIIISKPLNIQGIDKIKIRPVLIKQRLCFQLTEFCGQKVMHSNVKSEEIIERLPQWFEGGFLQAELQHKAFRINILLNKKGTVTVKLKEETAKDLEVSLSHNRNKKYILEEGCKAPFLIDLGIMSTDGKIVNARYDKYRQINRFLEFVEDVLPYLKDIYEKEKRELRIIDFGCGKSYLTFAMYYYLKELKGYPVRITGLDLKEDVILHCNEMKDRYGYNELQFLQGDIADYNGAASVDMVVTLHACDTATDYALYKAASWNAKVILSVPCCQHEVNSQIYCKEWEILLKHGIIKERMSALITDAMRAELLEENGYRAELLEFIDMEHTPKNILIRAVRTEKTRACQNGCKGLMEQLHIEPTLYRLFNKKDGNGQ